MSVWGPDGLVSRPGEGIRIEMGEHGMEVLARSTQTDGQFGVFDFRHGPIEANPPHAHLGFAKVLYVLEGYYDFRVGDVEARADQAPSWSSRAGVSTRSRRPGAGSSSSAPGGQRGDVHRAGRSRTGGDAGAVSDITARWQTVSPPGEAALPWRPRP